MRTVIVGARGQLGTALAAHLASSGTHETILLDHAAIEISDAASVQAAIEEARPECVINAAAYNYVDRAEEEPAAAFQANGLGPRNLARASALAGAMMVHVSTDYVFGGTSHGVPLREIDSPFPTCAYALSKLVGEYFVAAECPDHLIVRTCGLYGRSASAGKGNFVKTILRLASQRKELTIVDDQHCTPSAATDVARAIVRLLEVGARGLFHATNSGATTWYGFAREIVRRAGLDVAVRPITSAEYPQTAHRPAYSVLDCGKLAATIGGPLPPWEEALGRYVAETETESGAP